MYNEKIWLTLKQAKFHEQIRQGIWNNLLVNHFKEMIMPYSFSKPIYALQNKYFCQIAKNVLFKQFKEKFTSLPFDTGELVKTWRSQAAGKLGPGSRQA